MKAKTIIITAKGELRVTEEYNEITRLFETDFGIIEVEVEVETCNYNKVSINKAHIVFFLPITT